MFKLMFRNIVLQCMDQLDTNLVFSGPGNVACIKIPSHCPSGGIVVVLYIRSNFNLFNIDFVDLDWY